jgi:hypothetical protein
MTPERYLPDPIWGRMTQGQVTLLPYVADAAEPSVNESEAAVKVPPQAPLPL